MAELIPVGTNWDLGFQSDVSRDQLNPKAAYRMKDYIPELDAPLTKRGGWTYGSPNLASISGAATSMASLGWLPFSADGLLAVVGDDGTIFSLQQFDGAGGTHITDTGDATIVPTWPIIYFKGGTFEGGIILGGYGQGHKAPKKFYDSSGYTVAALGGTPPEARMGFTWGSYLALGNYYDPGDSYNLKNNRLAFCAPNDPETWTLTASGSIWDFPGEIVAGVPTLSAILVFTWNDCYLFSGDTPPPGGNMSSKILFSGLGTIDGRSAVQWRNYAVWANAAGVYQSDGATLTDLTAAGGISQYYRSIVSGFSITNGWKATGGIYRDRYILSIHDDSTYVTTFVCDLSRGVWTEWTNFPTSNFAHRAAGPGTALYGGDEELFFAHASQPYVGNTSALWTPTASNDSDGDSTAVLPVLETGFFKLGALDDKRIKAVYPGYDLVDPSSLNPTLTVAYTLSPAPGASYTTLSTKLAATLQFIRRKLRIGTSALGIAFKITQDIVSADTRIYSLEVEAHPQEQERVNPGGAASGGSGGVY